MAHEDNKVNLGTILLIVLSCLATTLAATPDLASAITIEQVTTTTAVAKWTKNTETGWVKYEIGITPSSSTVQLTPHEVLLAEASPQTTISGLTAGTEYTLSVNTADASAKGTVKTVKFYTLPNGVNQFGVGVTDITENSAKVTFPAGTGLFNSYDITIALSAGGAGGTVTRASINKDNADLSSTLTGLTPGTKYTITIKTKAGTSTGTTPAFGAAAAREFTTLPVSVNQATIATKNLLTTTVTLEWTEPSGNYDKYDCKITGTNSGSVSINPRAPLKGTNGGKISVAVSSLTAGTTYSFIVKTMFWTKLSTEAKLDFTTAPLPVSASSIIFSAIEMTTVTVTWGKPSGAFISCGVSISPSQGVAIVNPSVLSAAPQSTGITGLTGGTQYTITITSKTGTSTGVGTDKLFKTKPQAASGITFANVDTNKATVGWSAPGGQYDSYIISILPAAGITVNPTTPLKGVTSTLVSALSAGTEYEIVITVKYGQVLSAEAKRKFTTLPLPVPASSITFSAIEMTTVTVTWGKPSGAFISCEVSISPSQGVAIVNPSVLSTATQSTGITGLTGGTQYTITITSKTGTSTGVGTNKLFKTKPQAASGITFANVDTNKATVGWSAPGGQYDSYIISILPAAGITINPTTPLKGVTSTQVTLLSAGTEYEIIITVKYGQVLSAETKKKFTTKPNPVTLGSMQITSITTTTAKLDWQKPAGTFTSYSIALKIGGNPAGGGAAANPSSPDNTKTTANLVSLIPGTTYEVVLTTKVGSAESVKTTKTFKTKPMPVLAASIIISNIATVTATAKWTEPSGIFTSCALTITPTATIAKPTVQSTDPQTTDIIGLTGGTEYTLTITCTSGTTTGDATTKKFTTKPMPVLAASIIISNIATVTATAKWTKPSGVFTSCALTITPTATIAKPTVQSTDPQTTDISGLTGGTEYTLTITCTSGSTTGDATTKKFTTNIDWCAANACHTNAECQNEKEFYKCFCKQGYLGTGKSCADFNECTAGRHDCSPNAFCANTIGSFTCTCKPGFNGAGKTCTDTDECALRQHNCHKYADCVNTPGSFKCQCKGGYQGDGVACQDINECSSTGLVKHKCHKGADCTNKLGGYDCACRALYLGDGRSCTKAKNAILVTITFTWVFKIAFYNPLSDSYIQLKIVIELKMTLLCNQKFFKSDKGGCKVTLLSFSPGSTVAKVAVAFDNSTVPQSDPSKPLANEVDTWVKDLAKPQKNNCSIAGIGETVCSKQPSAVDVNECTTADPSLKHKCHATLAKCINTPGSYQCLCNTGYSGDGKTCNREPSTKSSFVDPKIEGGLIGVAMVLVVGVFLAVLLWKLGVLKFSQYRKHQPGGETDAYDDTRIEFTEIANQSTPTYVNQGMQGDANADQSVTKQQGAGQLVQQNEPESDYQEIADYEHRVSARTPQTTSDAELPYAEVYSKNAQEPEADYYATGTEPTGRSTTEGAVGLDRCAKRLRSDPLETKDSVGHIPVSTYAHLNAVDRPAYMDFRQLSTE